MRDLWFLIIWYLWRLRSRAPVDSSTKTGLCIFCVRKRREVARDACTDTAFTTCVPGHTSISDHGLPNGDGRSQSYILSVLVRIRNTKVTENVQRMCSILGLWIYSIVGSCKYIHSATQSRSSWNQSAHKDVSSNRKHWGLMEKWWQIPNHERNRSRGLASQFARSRGADRR